MKKTCPSCGKSFKDSPGKRPRRFCSKECTNAWRYESSSAKRAQRCITVRNPKFWRWQLTLAAREFETPPKRRIMLVCGTTMGRGIDRLVSVIQYELGADPFNGDLYVFCDEARNSLRYLEWDGAGFCLGYRKAQVGTYPWPSAEWCATIEITEKEFLFLRSGSIVEP